MLNDLFTFESKLSVDEVEDEIREEQNAHFIEGKAVHTFGELTSILDYMPEGIDSDDEHPVKGVEEETDDISELDAEEEEKLKNDESLKWDEDEEAEDGEGRRRKRKKRRTARKRAEGKEEVAADKDDERDEKPRRRSKGKR